MGKIGKWFFLLLMIGQSLGAVQAASESAQNNRGQMEGMQGETMKESSWVHMNQRISRQEEKKCRSGKQKESNMLRCTLLNGSAWSTEKFLRRYKGTFDIFFGVEHRVRKEEMEETLNKEAKQDWRFAADSARITDEKASSEDRKHTSGGVFVAIDGNLGAVIGKEEGAVESIPGNEGRIAPSMGECARGMRVLSVYSWHLEGWTPRNEA